MNAGLKIASTLLGLSLVALMLAAAALFFGAGNTALTQENSNAMTSNTGTFYLLNNSMAANYGSVPQVIVPENTQTVATVEFTEITNAKKTDAEATSNNLVAALPDDSSMQLTATEELVQAADSLTINGETIHYVDTYLADTAPSEGAGLWRGDDSTTDGSWGYFIGHNPGPFEVVSTLHEGNQVTVTDDNGDSRTYTVEEIIDVPSTTNWSEVEAAVVNNGESIALQTCMPNDIYRIVIAI